MNRALVRWLNPTFDYEWTVANALLWASHCLPSTVLAVLMALLLPRLDSLTGLLNSITGSTVQGQCLVLD